MNNVAGRSCCGILRTDRGGSVEEPEGRALEYRSRLIESISSECWMKWILSMCVAPTMLDVGVGVAELFSHY